MKVETAYLKTANNYALSNKVSTSYIYRLIRENKIEALEIDGVKFIDINKYPNLPSKK